MATFGGKKLATINFARNRVRDDGDRCTARSGCATGGAADVVLRPGALATAAQPGVAVLQKTSGCGPPLWLPVVLIN